MNKQQIECFVTIAEYRNFTDAAQRLYISQPALSRQLSGLEQELNCKLLNRNNKEVSLTRAGEVMLNHFKKWTQNFDEALLEASLTEQLEKQSIRIGLISGLKLDSFLDVISAEQNNGENNSVLLKRMVHSEIVVALQRGQLDAAVTFDDSLFDGQNIGTIKLTDAGFDFVLSRRHYLVQKGNFSGEDIQQLVIAAQRGVIGTPREIYINTMRDLKKTFGESAVPKKLLSFSNMEDVIDFVKSCSGAAIINSQTQSNIEDEKFLKLPMAIRRGLVYAWNIHQKLPLLKCIEQQIEQMKNY